MGILHGLVGSGLRLRPGLACGLPSSVQLRGNLVIAVLSELPQRDELLVTRLLYLAVDNFRPGLAGEIVIRVGSAAVSAACRDSTFAVRFFPAVLALSCPQAVASIVEIQAVLALRDFHPFLDASGRLRAEKSEAGSDRLRERHN